VDGGGRFVLGVGVGVGVRVICRYMYVSLDDVHACGVNLRPRVVLSTTKPPLVLGKKSARGMPYLPTAGGWRGGAWGVRWRGGGIGARVRGWGGGLLCRRENNSWASIAGMGLEGIPFSA